MKYKVRTVRGKRPYVQVDFEDEKYNLVGEMLLAERGLLNELIRSLDSVLDGGEESGSFAGNAFSVSITRETANITNDINGEETLAPSKELRKLTKVYQKQYVKL